MLPRCLVVSAALLLSLSLVACGGDGPSQEEYAAEIDEVCERMSAQAQELGEPGSTEEIVAFATGMRELIQEGVQEIEDIERPEEGEARELADEYVTALRETGNAASAALEELEEAAREGDEEGIMAAGEAIAVLEGGEAGEKARELGAEVCGQSA